MIKNEDLDKLASKMGPLFIILLLLVTVHVITYIIQGATRLVQQTYQLGYGFGSLIEKLF
ncbi:hypothetical protein PaeBR_21760 [Paenibacillus sp. BR2-3]|uniref:hypothetical protein n=1 Tax=Paenibacillus sp. BR2-3 TaxID=3048494 RepID=UPI003977B855